MKKNNKKLDKKICQALTKVCKIAKEEMEGFQWITHLVDYKQFPKSLSVICIFDTRTELEQARQLMKDDWMVNLIKIELEQINILFKDINGHVVFDIEESCEAEHNGNWQKRLNLYND